MLIFFTGVQRRGVIFCMYVMWAFVLVCVRFSIFFGLYVIDYLDLNEFLFTVFCVQSAFKI